MRKLLVIYFLGLVIGTLWPASVSSVQFLNISDSVDFEIDLNSPVLALEKDLASYQERKPAAVTAAVTNLNQSVKREVPRHIRLVDYSKNLADIHNSIGLTLVGPLELKQGLALTDENRIEIHREEKGHIVEYGDVDIENGTYAIKLSSLNGHVCARLRGSSHEIMGQGCFSLDHVKAINKSSKAGPLLSLSKYQDVLALKKSTVPDTWDAPQTIEVPVKAKPASTVRAAYQIYDYYESSSPNPRPLPDVTIENSVAGTEDDSSTVITMISSPGFATIRTVSNSHTPTRGVLMPRRGAVQAARSIAQDLGYATRASMDIDAGMVWGRATRDGMAVAGAQVSIEGYDGLKPLYLNEFYIPDVNQTSTASHGLFTFMEVPDGDYSLKAELGSQLLGFQNASVRAGTVALADIEGTIRRKEARISVYDLINKTRQSAVVTLQNYEEDLIVENGYAEVQVQDSKDLAFAIVNPLNRSYLTTQYPLQPNEDLYNLPLIPQAWLESILVQARLKQAVKSKIVLGIGATEPYRIIPVGSKNAQIVYFNDKGEVIQGNTGSAGGGFLVIDPEDNVVEYAIQYATKKELRVQYMPSQVGVVSVIPMY